MFMLCLWLAFACCSCHGCVSHSAGRYRPSSILDRLLSIVHHRSTCLDTHSVRCYNRLRLIKRSSNNVYSTPSADEDAMMRKGHRPTIVEVARAAGVSITTVSVVLNERQGAVRISDATRQVVKDVAQRLGYIPHQAAQRLRRQRSTMLTLLIGSLANPYFTDIAASVQAQCDSHGYELNIVDASSPEAELHTLEQLRNGSSAGVIVATGRHEARGAAVATLQELVQLGLPAVMLCDRSPDPAIPAIRIDDTAGAAEATRHLLELGHRRIAYFSTPFDSQAIGDPAVAADRYRGYLGALQGAGITGDPAWLVQGEAALSGGYAMMRELLNRPGPRPTAVFCTCDVMAVGALRALYEAGVRVPKQMAVVGFDGVKLGQYTTPALTTINQPRE
jgi:LacI family repressor for deo operon, udp, cdd, tsx, nupC, and nupG